MDAKTGPILAMSMSSVTALLVPPAPRLTAWTVAAIDGRR